MSKFEVGNHVRVTDPKHSRFDEVGRVRSVARVQRWWSYFVEFDGESHAIAEHHLILAVPAVTDTLDEMDAETAAFDRAVAVGKEAQGLPEPLADWELELLSGRRSVILRTAEKLINGQRAKDYDTKDDATGNFTRIGKLWEQILGAPVTPEQVALCMAQVKIARLITSPTHEDSWIDIAGYAALGGEIASLDAAL